MSNKKLSHKIVTPLSFGEGLGVRLNTPSPSGRVGVGLRSIRATCLLLASGIQAGEQVSAFADSSRSTKEISPLLWRGVGGEAVGG